MKMKSLVFICMFLTSVVSVNAQREKCDTCRQNRVEEFKVKKAEFLKKELQLTDAQAAAFIPLVNELMDKKYEASRTARMDMRTIQQKKDKSDADYKKAIDGMLDSQVKEAELQKEYYQKFAKVLPIEKVYKYHQAEMKFMKRAVEGEKRPQGNMNERKASERRGNSKAKANK